MTTSFEPRPPSLSLLSLFLKFLGFGAMAFGGPVAQIAMIRRALVEEERWISSARFNKLIAVMQALPGPEAHELCVHLGVMARGRWGGVLAGLGFMAPGFVLMLGAAWLYDTFLAGRMIWVGALTGVQIMVLALIARAVEKIGRHAIAGARLSGVAVFALAATLLHAPFWLPLVVGGVVGVLRAPRLVLAGLLIVALGLAYLMGDRTAGPSVAIQASEPTLWLLFLAGLKGGLLTFGGAYTAIPYVQADTVGRGWISGPAFLDGVAFAGVLPAPLVIFSTFAGYLAGGVPGALVITAGMFLPAFAFSLVLYERLEALVEAPTLHDTLTGVAAAVVGVIAGVWLRMAWTTGAAVPSLVVGMLIFIVALTAIWRLKSRWAAPVVIIGGAVAGHLALG